MDSEDKTDMTRNERERVQTDRLGLQSAARSCYIDRLRIALVRRLERVNVQSELGAEQLIVICDRGLEDRGDATTSGRRKFVHNKRMVFY